MPSRSVLSSYTTTAAPSPPVQAFDHSWTLALEEQFYLLWPLMLFAVLKFWRRWALPIILLGAAVSAAFT